MKQILFAVLLCVCSICSAQKTTSKSPDKPQYYADLLDGDTFHLKFKDRYNNAVDSDNLLCNIVKFKRISDNEMLLVGSKQDYRLIVDCPFKLEWKKISTDNFHGFELLGLYVSVPNYKPDMTVKVKIEDPNQKVVLNRVYGLLPAVDLCVEYVGTDQKQHTVNLDSGWFEHDIDPKKDIRFFLKERGGKILPPISKISFARDDCMDCSPPANEGGVLSVDMRNFLAYGRLLSARNSPWLNERVYICAEYKIGVERKRKVLKVKKAWPFGVSNGQAK